MMGIHADFKPTFFPIIRTTVPLVNGHSPPQQTSHSDITQNCNNPIWRILYTPLAGCVGVPTVQVVIVNVE